jgi:hypothetical protein
LEYKHALALEKFAKKGGEVDADFAPGESESSGESDDSEGHGDSGMSSLHNVSLSSNAKAAHPAPVPDITKHIEKEGDLIPDPKGQAGTKFSLQVTMGLVSRLSEKHITRSKEYKGIRVRKPHLFEDIVFILP